MLRIEQTVWNAGSSLPSDFVIPSLEVGCRGNQEVMVVVLSMGRLQTVDGPCL